VSDAIPTGGDIFSEDEDEGEGLSWPGAKAVEVSSTEDNEDQVSQAVEEAVEHVMVLDNSPLLDDALILRLTYDLACRIHPYETIARRYGLQNVAELHGYLLDHPTVLVEAKKLRAMFDSDESVETRVRTKFMHSIEDLIPTLHNLVKSPQTPVSARVDGFKQLQRGAGVDGLPVQQRGTGTAGPSGQAFQLNIFFRNGQSTRISGTTVLDAAEIPDPPASELLDDFQKS
jgi:hypothetical protein